MNHSLRLQRILADSRLYFVSTSTSNTQPQNSGSSDIIPLAGISDSEWDPYLVWHRRIRINR